LLCVMFTASTKNRRFRFCTSRQLSASSRQFSGS
jgi:hypothetical protein